MVSTSFVATPPLTRLTRAKVFTGATLTAMAFIAAPSYAIDSASIEVGSGNKTQLIRIGAQWKWEKQWDVLENAQLSGYWDLNLAGWRGKRHEDRPDEHQTLVAIGFTPVFRFAQKDSFGTYFEFGTGPHLLSERYDNNRRQLSTSFQFGSHLGIGYVFTNGLDISARYQHFSNASIKKPNDGVNFTVIRVAYPF